MNVPRIIANVFGYDLVRISKYHPTIESHLQMLLSNMAIDVVLDVGANTGGFGKMLRKIGYQEHIVSFEPVKRSYDVLTMQSKGDRLWTAFNYALGAEQSEPSINVPKPDDFSSFLNVTTSAKEIWSDVFTSVDKETVRVECLDDVFPGIEKGLAGCHSIFLKMDTQGYDLEVLKGAKEVLTRIRGLQSEISMIPIYQGMPDYLESLTLFRQKGFELTGLYPVSRNKDTLGVVEMDCVMRRRDLS
ncbi:MAG: FkbM family methyltransferase [Desulfobulbaceae bacterium]